MSHKSIDLQSAYEKLRQNHRDGIHGSGMGVFLQQGMCGWILAETDNEYDFNDKKLSKKDLQQTSGNYDKGDDLVTLIASIILTESKGGQ